MNPAALKAKSSDLTAGPEIIVNTDGFTKRARTKVVATWEPAEDDSAGRLRRDPVPLTTLTLEA